MLWHKKVTNGTGFYEKIITYRNVDSLSEIWIMIPRNIKEKISFTIKNNPFDRNTYPEGKKISQALNKANIINDFLGHEINARFSFSDRNNFVPFIEAFEQFYSIQSIKKDIFETIDIKAIIDEQEFYKSLDQLIKENKINEAITKASAIDTDDDVLFKLGQLLENNQRYVEALDLYQEISPTNPNYQEANMKTIHIIMQYESNENLSIEEKNSYLKAKVRFMLRANKSENQHLLDKRFAELSEDKDPIPHIKNIKIDEDTILNLAEEMAFIRKENEALKQQIQALLEKSKPNVKNFPNFFDNISPCETVEDKYSGTSSPRFFEDMSQKNINTNELPDLKLSENKC